MPALVLYLLSVKTGPSLLPNLFKHHYITHVELAELNIKLSVVWGLIITADIYSVTVHQELFQARSCKRSHFVAFIVKIISLHGTSGPKEKPITSIY